MRHQHVPDLRVGCNGCLQSRVKPLLRLRRAVGLAPGAEGGELAKLAVARWSEEEGGDGPRVVRRWTGCCTRAAGNVKAAVLRGCSGLPCSVRDW